MSNTYLTQEGLEKLKKELEELKTIERKRVAKRIQEAKDLGDLAENTEYASAREEQSFIEGRIAELENIIRNVVIIEETKDSSQIDFGSTVTIEIENQIKKFSIVGSQEADPGQGKISYRSPLGQAFLGKQAGDEIEVEVPAGKIKFKIIKVN